jgi:hypothetical protein
MELLFVRYSLSEFTLTLNYVSPITRTISGLIAYTFTSPYSPASVQAVQFAQSPTAPLLMVGLSYSGNRPILNLYGNSNKLNLGLGQVPFPYVTDSFVWARAVYRDVANGDNLGTSLVGGIHVFCLIVKDTKQYYFGNYTLYHAESLLLETRPGFFELGAEGFSSAEVITSNVLFSTEGPGTAQYPNPLDCLPKSYAKCLPQNPPRTRYISTRKD